MRVECKTLVLLTCSVFLVASCSPKKNEEVPPPESKQEAPLKEMKKEGMPAPQHEKQMTPPSGQHPKEEGTLTPEQKEELEINEDNVMNPFPG